MWAAWFRDQIVICGSLPDVFAILQEENCWFETRKVPSALQTIDVWMRHGALVFVEV